MQISSLKESLQQAKQDYKSQTERADSLKNRCTVLQEKVENLKQEIIEKEKEQVLKKKEITDTSSQTEDGFCEVRALPFKR